MFAEMKNMQKDTQHLPKLVVILGPTASGKTGLSLTLAKKFNGEIISADSRQIFKKMNIGTAKPKGEWRWNGLRKTFFVEDIPHHLIDFLDPGKVFTVAEFRDKALKYTKMAYQAGRVPIIVGGTGLYISSVVDNYIIPRVNQNPKLRASLSEKSNEELLALLENLDPEAVKIIDVANQRRIIRALEVCILSGERFSKQRKKGDELFNVLQIGIDISREDLYRRINERTEKMMEDGLLGEAQSLLKQKYGWNLSSMNSIGYKQLRGYFEKTLDLDQTLEMLKRDTRHFAKRQITWFKRDKRINWCVSEEQAVALVGKFLQE